VSSLILRTSTSVASVEGSTYNEIFQRKQTKCISQQGAKENTWILKRNEMHKRVSPDTFKVTKSRRVRWAGHVPCTGEIKCRYKTLVRKPEGK
jgi:beta-lactamase class D